MTEHEIEPVPGLPGKLPPGERILWQGAPDRATLARTAFHTNLVLGYFALLTVLAIVRGGSLFGVAATAACGIGCFALLHLLAWGSARTTLYTLTDRRIVLRIGVAVPKCINLPLALVGSAGLRLRESGMGDLPVALNGPRQLGYIALWPHIRPWRLAAAEPMLRAVPDAESVAALLAETCRVVAAPAARPEIRIVDAAPAPLPVRVSARAVAA